MLYNDYKKLHFYNKTVNTKSLRRQKGCPRRLFILVKILRYLLFDRCEIFPYFMGFVVANHGSDVFKGSLTNFLNALKILQ